MMQTLYRKENGKIVGMNADAKKAARMLARGWVADRALLEDAPKKRGRKKKAVEDVD